MVSPQAAIGAIRAAMAPDDILVSDVGAHKLWLGRLFPAYEPNTVIISNGFATMGIGLPGAIAAGLATPERRVVTVCGDGGFLMNVQEMETATRLGAARGRGRLGGRRPTASSAGSRSAASAAPHAIHFGNPEWADLARAFGWSHRHATDGPALTAALEAAFAGDGPRAGHRPDRLPPQRPSREPGGAGPRRLSAAALRRRRARAR